MISRFRLSVEVANRVMGGGIGDKNGALDNLAMPTPRLVGVRLKRFGKIPCWNPLNEGLGECMGAVPSPENLRGLAGGVPDMSNSVTSSSTTPLRKTLPRQFSYNAYNRI